MISPLVLLALSCGDGADTGEHPLVAMGTISVRGTPCDAGPQEYLQSPRSLRLSFASSGDCEEGQLEYALFVSGYWTVEGCVTHARDGFLTHQGEELYTPADTWYGGATADVEYIYLAGSATHVGTGIVQVKSDGAAGHAGCYLLAYDLDGQ